MHECQAQGAECLYFLADTDEAESFQLAEERGFRLVDIRVTLTWTGNELSIREILPPIRPARLDDIPELQSIASKAYDKTRFYADPRFASKAPSLYRTWIEQSVRGDADIVLVAELDGRPVGYVTGHQKSQQEGHIGLLGVSSSAQGGGVGQALVECGMDWFLQRGIRQVHVVTQGSNIAAQHLYQNCGFRTSKTQLWFHWWSSQD